MCIVLRIFTFNVHCVYSPSMVLCFTRKFSFSVFCVFVHINVGADVYTDVYHKWAHACQRPEVNNRHLPPLFSTFPEPGTHWPADWPVSFREWFISAPMELVLTHGSPEPWVLNSGSYDCVADALPSEPSPPIHIISLRNRINFIMISLKGAMPKKGHTQIYQSNF